MSYQKYTNDENDDVKIDIEDDNHDNTKTFKYSAPIIEEQSSGLENP
jgi:hypothetical protein